MRKALRLAVIILSLLALGIGFSYRSYAQTYPTKPIKIVVPTTPGGGADTMARVIGQRLGENLGTQVIVENKPGASAIIGTQFAAKSPADGYTLLIVYNELAVNPSLHRSLPYDAINDFQPVTLLGSTPFVLVVHPSLQATSVKELVALAKSKPKQLNYASGGTGGVLHLAGLLFASMAGIDVVHVPYKSSPPGVTDLLVGQVQYMFPTLITVQQHVKAGKLRAIGITSSHRVGAMPDLPTIAESGVPGYEASIWYGIVVPAGTPMEIVAKLNTEFARILASPDMKDRFALQGAALASSSPDQLGRHIKVEMDKWASTIKGSGIRIE